MRTSVILLVLLASFLVGPNAQAQAQEQPESAQGSEDKQRASEHFRRGVELFHEGAFRAAQVEFQRAYDISPDYRLLYNIGQAQVQLHDYLGANQSYERYLVDGGAQISDARRQEVETALEALRERVAKLSIQVSEEGAEVYVDDQRVGESPLPSTVAVNVGRHRVYARSPRGGQAELAVDVAGGDLKQVNLVIASSEVSAPVAPAQVAAPVAEPAGLTAMQRTAVVAWSTGGAALIGAVVSGVLAGKKSDDLDAELAKRPPEAEASRSKVDQLRNSADTLALTTDVLAAGALALVVTGTVLWFVGDQRSEPEAPVSQAALRKPEIKVGPRSLGVALRF